MKSVIIPKDSKLSCKIIFIVGSGRSGTHFVGEALSLHPEISGRIEKYPTFNLITYLGTRQDLQLSMLTRIQLYLIKAIFSILMSLNTKVILEKSHSSLWIAEYLLKRLPDSHFIGVYRGVEATVASMLKHKEVLKWYNVLPNNKVNKFLGITENNVGDYADLSIEEKCALRWESHYKELFRLHKLYSERFHLVQYEKVCESPNEELNRVLSQLGLNQFNLKIDVKNESLKKWEKELSQDQIKKIRRIANQ